MMNILKNNKFKLFILSLFLIGLILGFILCFVIIKTNPTLNFPWYGWIIIPLCTSLLISMLIYGVFNIFGVFKRMK
ncbi:hypothetical protein VO56_00465 [Mycoplasmopsis gallinacea]|uniref:Uncharacterized protein n=1 Tax=Mycoplasmopsis gallinacea TaxID=29556 RepID=A0A0D5ZIY1_9BACT|nr:hypothetical protein VO56_00465 [Mycoplasmopsis gallinacea]